MSSANNASLKSNASNHERPIPSTYFSRPVPTIISHVFSPLSIQHQATAYSGVCFAYSSMWRQVGFFFLTCLFISILSSSNLLMDTTFAARSRMVKKVLNQVILSELSFYILLCVLWRPVKMAAQMYHQKLSNLDLKFYYRTTFTSIDSYLIKSPTICSVKQRTPDPNI